jgi:Phosphatidylinositol-specific phospholipase C, X domain
MPHKFYLAMALLFFSMQSVADCPDVTTYCYSYLVDTTSPMPHTSMRIKSGSKWHWQTMSCKPIADKSTLIKACHRRYPSTHSVIYPHGSFKLYPSYYAHREKQNLLPSSDWMGQLAVSIPAFANAPIKEIILPGTHDSATYNITTDSPYSPDESNTSKILKLLGNTKFIHGIYARWSKTQVLNINQQLNHGIRYLDIRLCGKNGIAYSCHAKYADKFSNIIKQIKSFIDKSGHEHEIILLDINHLYNMSFDTHERTIDAMNKAFGDKIASRDSFDVHTSLKTFWQHNKQVIIFYNDYPSINRHTQLWTPGSILSIWPNKQKASELKKVLYRNLTRKRDRQFYVVQTQLTADESLIKKSIIDPFLPKSVHAYALSYKQSLYDFLYSHKALVKKYGNIISEDWSFGNGLTHLAILLNREKFELKS